MTEPLDTVVRGGRVVLEDGVIEVDIGIRAGRIAGLHAPASRANAEQVIDAAGKLVLPGAIDSHVHMRDPGQTHKEDFASGTRAAASAGVTTVICQPNTSPPLVELDAIEQAIAAGHEKAIVDFAITAAVRAAEPETMAAVAASGLVVGFEILDDPHSLDSKGWVRLIETAAGVGLPLSKLCYDTALVEHRRSRLERDGNGSARDFSRQVDDAVEVAGLSRVIPLVRALRAHYIVRSVTTPGAIAYLRDAKRSGAWESLLAVEVAPHQLFASADELDRLGPFATMFPPLREPEERAALWDGIADGTVDFIATDHAPHSQAEKEAAHGDVWSAPVGIPALETFIPLLLDAWLSGRLGLSQLVELVARKPARVHGLYPRKGTILPGSDADLMIVDPDVHWTFDKSRVYTAAGYSIFEGRTGRGWPEVTMVRGTIVARDGRPVVSQPVGRLVQVGRANSDGRGGA